MNAFTVGGFISEGGRYFDFNVHILADTPFEAKEKVMEQYSNLVVSSVCRAYTERLGEY